MKDPTQEGFWYMMDPLMPCLEINLVVRNYVGKTCDDSSQTNYYEDATPSGFCVASGVNQMSRRLLCHGEDHHEELLMKGVVPKETVEFERMRGF